MSESKSMRRRREIMEETLTPKLTDAEREALWFAIAYAQNAGHECEAALRGLLERLK